MDYLNSLFNLQNKVAVITGGSGVLGSEMAKGLLRAGASVILLGTTEEKLTRTVESLRTIGENIRGFRCDVLDKSAVQEINSYVLDTFGSVDILINGAGGNMPGATIGINQSVFDLDVEEFKKVTDLNLLGTVLPSLVFAKSMAERKSGSIINISSMAAARAMTRVAGYSAAKAAIENFTKWLAMEMGLKFGDGIRVNAIAPGFLLTQQNKTLLTNSDGSMSERGKRVIAMTPFQRFGAPEELVGTVLWLASSASKFVTGAVIPVDGGFSIFSGV